MEHKFNVEYKIRRTYRLLVTAVLHNEQNAAACELLHEMIQERIQGGQTSLR